jgi:hypothetical protein
MAMDEVLWYSRLILWVGAIILLAEAVSGRSAALFSIVATLCLAGGFATFLAALALGRGHEMPETAGATADDNSEIGGTQA